MKMMIKNGKEAIIDLRIDGLVIGMKQTFNLIDLDIQLNSFNVRFFPLHFILFFDSNF